MESETSGEGGCVRAPVLIRQILEQQPSVRSVFDARIFDLFLDDRWCPVCGTLIETFGECAYGSEYSGETKELREFAIHQSCGPALLAGQLTRSIKERSVTK